MGKGGGEGLGQAFPPEESRKIALFSSTGEDVGVLQLQPGSAGYRSSHQEVLVQNVIELTSCGEGVGGSRKLIGAQLGQPVEWRRLPLQPFGWGALGDAHVAKGGTSMVCSTELPNGSCGLTVGTPAFLWDKVAVGPSAAIGCREIDGKKEVEMTPLHSALV